MSHLNDQNKYHHIYYSSLNPSTVFTNEQYMESFESVKFNFFHLNCWKKLFCIHYSTLVVIVFLRLNYLYRALPLPAIMGNSFILNFIFIKFYVLIFQKNIQNLFLHIQRNFTSNLFSIRSLPGDSIVWVLLLFYVYLIFDNSQGYPVGWWQNRLSASLVLRISHFRLG